MALYQFNGKTASFLFLNGRVIKNWMPLKMSYTIDDPSELHTFNSGFIYEMEVYENDSGTYTVNIYSEDDFTSFKCNTNTISIEYLELTSNVTNMSYMFENCKSLTSLDLSSFDTSNVTDMSYMFYYCKSLISLDLSSFDTSNVTDMSYMFNNCTSLTSLDLSNFDTSKVKYMSEMFYNCKSLISLDLSSFDTSNVTDMSNMFNGCTSLTSLDLSNFNTSKVKYMSIMFFRVPITVDWHYDGSNYQNWTLTEEQTSFSGTFQWNITYTVTVNYIDDNNRKIIDPYIITVKNKNSYDMGNEVGLIFDGFTHLETQGTVSGIATSNITITNIYKNNNYVEYAIESTTSSVPLNYKYTNSNGETYYTYLPNHNKTSHGWRYGVITLTDGSTTTDLTTPVKNVDKVKIYYSNETTFFGFNLAYNIEEILYMRTDNFTTFKDMFKSCNIKKIDLTGWNTEKVTSMENMFSGCSELNQVIGLEGLNVKNLTSTSYMFYRCDKLTGSLNFSWTNTDKIRYAESMFYYCKSLISLDLSSFDTSNVTDMSNMFDSCSSLISLDLSSFDTSNVTNMHGMFYYCNKLTSLDLSSFDTSKVTSSSLMFSSVPKTVDFHYDGTNYQNWTLTETETSFSGTFPWNK